MSSKKLCLYYLLGVAVFYLWYQAWVNVLYAGTLLAYDSFADFIVGCLVNGSMILLMFLINTAIVYGLKWRRNHLVRILLDLALSLIAPTIVNGIFLLIAFMAGKKPTVLWMQSYVVNMMIFMLNEGVLFLINYKKSQRLAAQLKYEVLRAQVNPHFLFNSLNILYSLTYLDIEKSREFIISLSSMYRYIMSHSGEMTVTVQEELEFLKPYTEVLKTLYYDSLDFEVCGMENVAEQRMLPYSLQLLVENVIKHNVVSREFPMKVSIDITPESIIVSNNLRPKDESAKSEMEKSTGIGLKYLKELIRLDGKECVVSNDGGIFRVEVPFISTGLNGTK